MNIYKDMSDISRYCLRRRKLIFGPPSLHESFEPLITDSLGWLLAFCHLLYNLCPIVLQVKSVG